MTPKRVRITRDFGVKFVQQTGLRKGIKVDVEPNPPPRPGQMWVRSPRDHTYCVLEPDEYEVIEL